MGMNASKRYVAKCEVDPTILPPPPPTPGSSGFGSEQPTAPSEPQPYINPKYINNPGTYEELHKRCKDLFPMPFEGAKVMINKSLNQGFHISHSVAMSAINPSGYRFGATYIGSELITPSDPALLLISDIDPSGNLNAQGIYSPLEALKLKYAVQVQKGVFASTQLSADIKGKDWTATLTTGNPNLFTNSGVGVVQFLQTITPKIAVGAEIVYQQSPQIPGGAASVISLSGRYTGAESVWSGFAGTAGLGLCYYRRVNEEIQVGVEMENNYHAQQPFHCALGYMFDFPKANFNMKGMIDNNLTVTGVFEKRLLPMPFSFALCGSMNHLKNQFRLGCAFTIGV